MGLFDLFKRNKPKVPARTYVKLDGRRNFEGAQINRLTDSWTTSPRDIDQLLEKQLRILIARSRDQAINNDYGRRFLGTIKANVVGPDGIQMQARILNQKGNPDQLVNDAIELEWRGFSRLGACDVTGTLSFIDALNMYISTVATDGEILIYHNESAVNASGYAFQLINSLSLDPTYNRSLENGNKIRMGIEFDVWRKPVAYHITVTDTREPNYNYHGRQYRRIPASVMDHRFIPEFMNQSRGIPWMASALMRMEMLHGYEESAVIASRVGASKMGIITSPDGNGYAGDGTDPSGNILTDAVPGAFEQLPEGWGLEAWNPAYPHQQFKDFVKATLRGISSGLGVSYNSLANDLEGVNFSSIRAGVLEEREIWKALQGWTVRTFCQPVYERWLRIQLARQNIKVKGQPLRDERFNKCCDVTWQPRRWSWVDPVKDVQANVMAVNNGMKTISDCIRETGKDPIDVWRERQREIQLMTDLGIPVEPASAGSSFSGGGNDGTDQTDQAATDQQANP